MTSLSYVKLDNSSNVESFSCGNEEHHFKLNHFLKEKALNHHSDFIGTTLLASKDEITVGYITLLADSIIVRKEEKELRENFFSKVFLRNKYETFPSLKIGRIAVHEDYQHRGKSNGLKVGTYLFKLSVAIATKSNDFMGVRFLTVDAKDNARDWYINKLNFRVLDQTKPNFLFYDLLGWKNE